MVDNLLSNALRYTDPGGRVVVRVRRGGDEAPSSRSPTPASGWAPAEAQRVFERFWRADRSRCRATGGAGVGLAIVRELVRAHGGHVDLRSKSGHGTTFQVRLPVTRRVAPGYRHAEVAAAPRPVPVPSWAT